jgi:molybdopterin-guanine dinucleotide biosynthesis protein A
MAKIACFVNIGAMSSQPKVLAVILAGGLARRMEGVCKPLLELDGRRLVDRIAESASGQGLDVALNLHELTAAATAPFRELGLPFIADAAPGHAGPMAGILGALDYAAAHHFDAVLSLPCDTPFLPEDLVRRLVHAAQATRDGLARAASGGRVHPVIALWPVRLRADLRRALIDEDFRALGKFQLRYDCAEVEWPAHPCDPFLNVNTPADLAEAEAILRRRP